mmetsp:Transcript_68329/g.137420  ORF Transcript_68329/g.137420 Transcript_68329/m.137420 type:complete len:82 (-) Transcript_68329:955-1200(-)
MDINRGKINLFRRLSHSPINQREETHSHCLLITEEIEEIDSPPPCFQHPSEPPAQKQVSAFLGFAQHHIEALGIDPLSLDH